MSDNRTLGRIVVHLRDGREIDVSGLAPDDVFARLRDAGVRRGDVVKTMHHVRLNVEQRARFDALLQLYEKYHRPR